MSSPEKIAKLMVQAAQNKKASRIVLQDLRGSSDLCDMQFVCSGDNDRQTKAIAQEIEETVFRELKLKPMSVEGRQTGNWVLLDFGPVMAHVFFNPVRDYYALEQLWPKAKFVDINNINAT
jgi:ribosome-associated protein